MEGTAAARQREKDAVQPADLLRALSEQTASQPETLEVLLRTPLQLSVRFGTARMPLRELLDLEENSVVELDRAAEGVVEVIVNNAVIATGEVVSVEGRYGVRILEVAGGSRLAMLGQGGK